MTREHAVGVGGAQLSKSTKAGAAGSVLICGARKPGPAPQHTDAQIKERTKEIKKELKDKNLTKEQKEKLKAEKKTLGLEKEGNAIARAYLAALDKAGQRNNLQLSDISITTNPGHDFSDQNLTADQLRKITSPTTEAFVLNYSSPIYLITTTGLYNNSLGNTQNEDIGGTVLSHEQVHTQGGGETDAYTRQRSVFQHFRNDFSPDRFREIDQQLQQYAEHPPQ